MKLSDYLSENGLSLHRFAKAAGLSPATVMRVRDGTVIPSRRTLLAIVTATERRVSVNELMSVCVDPDDAGSIQKLEE